MDCAKDMSKNECPVCRQVPGYPKRVLAQIMKNKKKREGELRTDRNTYAPVVAAPSVTPQPQQHLNLNTNINTGIAIIDGVPVMYDPGAYPADQVRNFRFFYHSLT